jgi:hypothetical protein
VLCHGLIRGVHKAAGSLPSRGFFDPAKWRSVGFLSFAKLSLSKLDFIFSERNVEK